MQTKNRNKTNSVVTDIRTNPGKYNFINAVKIIECHFVHNFNTSDISTYSLFNSNTPYHLEPIKFHSSLKLSFPANSISATQQNTDNKSGKWDIETTFFGITGSSGVLPYHYSEDLQRRYRNKDTSLHDFLDLFTHRSISLYYRAAVKYNYPLEFSRHNKDITQLNDTYTKCLLAINGLGTKYKTGRMTIKDIVFARYTGLFSQTNRTAANLKQILESYFNTGIKIIEFTGRWATLSSYSRTRIAQNDRTAQSNILGADAIIGSKIIHMQSELTIEIGPVEHDDMINYAPDSKLINEFKDIVNMYLGPTIKYQLVLNINLNKSSKLSKCDSSCQIGWNARLDFSDNLIEDNQQHKLPIIIN